MNRDTLLANLTAVPGIMAERHGAYFVRVRLGAIWHDIDARHVVAQPPLVSALWSQQRGDGPAITKPEAVKSTNVASSDYEPDEVPPFVAALDDEPLQGDGAKPEAQAFVMPDDGKPDIDLPEIPEWMNHPVREIVEGH